jgi:hypothetical protein
MSQCAYATLLFTEPDFLSGMGSALDLSASMVHFNVSRTPSEADYVALRSDLMAVGSDMIKAAQERIQALQSAK